MKKIEDQLTQEELKKISPEKLLEMNTANLKGDMKIRNFVRSTLLNEGDKPSLASSTKAVTVRLSFEEYAKLKVLSDVLGASVSGLAKRVLVDGLSETFLAVGEVKDDEFNSFTGDLAESIHCLAMELHQDEQENI